MPDRDTASPKAKSTVRLTKSIIDTTQLPTQDRKP